MTDSLEVKKKLENELGVSDSVDASRRVNMAAVTELSADDAAAEESVQEQLKEMQNNEDVLKQVRNLFLFIDS